MPPTIYAKPDDGTWDAVTTPVPADRGWVQAAQAWIMGHSGWAAYAIAGLLAVLLVLSIRSRRKRTTAERTGSRQELTRTDKAITRITGLVATAVLAQGMWVFFGDVLHLPEILRVVLFAFVEFQIISAWRRALRTLHRHGHLGTAVRTIYVLAFGSALIASWHATSAQLGGFRWFVAFVAAYMIAEELAEELDIYLTANPDKRPVGKKHANRRINWALTPERVLVWLRLAEPSEREVEEIERQRRIARFARTAYRLDTLKVAAAAKWRLGIARRSLRRQAEVVNEHLKAATDSTFMVEFRSQLAFLYQVEDGTTRAAVADLSPFRPAPRLAIAATPFVISAPSQDARSEALKVSAEASLDGSHAANQERSQAEKPVENHAANGGGNNTAKAAESVTEKPNGRTARPAKRLVHPLADDPTPSVRALAKAYARKPLATNAELAKLAKVSEGSANRHLPKIRQAAVDSENADADEERAQGLLNLAPFATPTPPVLAGVNGHDPTTTEEN
jgi:hypothetical protein